MQIFIFMKKCILIGIYLIISPSGKKYIGSSNNIKRRFNQYKKLQCKTQKKLYHSLTKYGFDNHSFEIIYQCKHNELFKWERYFGEQFNVIDDGLNSFLPGYDDIPKILSEGTKQKISNSLKGNVPVTKGKTKKEYPNLKGNTNKRYGEDNSFFGKKHTENTKSILSFKSSSYLKNQYKLGKINPMSKKLIDINTNKIYNSITECARELGINRRTLTGYLSGEYKNKYPNIKLLIS